MKTSRNSHKCVRRCVHQERPADDGVSQMGRPLTPRPTQGLRCPPGGRRARGEALQLSAVQAHPSLPLHPLGKLGHMTTLKGMLGNVVPPASQRPVVSPLLRKRGGWLCWPAPSPAMGTAFSALAPSPREVTSAKQQVGSAGPWGGAPLGPHWWPAG